jgi:hypothetical protein
MATSQMMNAARRAAAAEPDKPPHPAPVTFALG